MENPLLVFALEHESQDLFLDYEILYTGVGKINAAYMLTRKLCELRPSMVINLGTVGSAVLQAGMVVQCTDFIQRDMDASPLGFDLWTTPFSDDPARLNYGFALENLRQVTCGTGDNFDTKHDGRHYEVVDMEGYALAKVCQRENVPFICLKYISDNADGSSAQDWGVALRNTATTLRATLDSLMPLERVILPQQTSNLKVKTR